MPRCSPSGWCSSHRWGPSTPRHRFGVAEPKVGLLSIGEEPGKGDTLRKEAYELLLRAPGINFIGNVEGRDTMLKTADVIVTDGFTGNVVLKTLEGGLKMLIGEILTAFASEPHYKPHADALLPALMPLYDADESRTRTAARCCWASMACASSATARPARQRC